MNRMLWVAFALILLNLGGMVLAMYAFHMPYLPYE